MIFPAAPPPSRHSSPTPSYHPSAPANIVYLPSQNRWRPTPVMHLVVRVFGIFHRHKFHVHISEEGNLLCNIKQLDYCRSTPLQLGKG